MMHLKDRYGIGCPHTPAQTLSRQDPALIRLIIFPHKWQINQESEGTNKVCRNRSIIYPDVAASNPLSIALKHTQE